MRTKHSGNFWTLTTHKPVRTLHKILLQSPVLERSVWAQIILTSVHLLFLKWSSWEVWRWPFAWNVSSSSDCSTKTQRPSAPRHSPKSRFPNFSVCSCWVCFQLSWEAATVASPFAQNTAGLPRRARHRRAGRLTKKGYFHVHDIGTFTSVAHIVWEVGPKRTILLQHVLWYFGNHGSH